MASNIQELDRPAYAEVGVSATLLTVGGDRFAVSFLRDVADALEDKILSAERRARVSPEALEASACDPLNDPSSEITRGSAPARSGAVAATEDSIVRSGWVAMQCIDMWLYDQSPEDTVNALFPDAHPEYVSEKRALFRKTPMLFWAALDYWNQRKLAGLALAEYGEEARKRLQINEKSREVQP